MTPQDAPQKSSFARDIRPLFTDVDVDHMKGFGLDLSSHADVSERADGIYQTVSTGAMPPPNSGGVRWTPEMCALFKRWQGEGCPP